MSWNYRVMRHEPQSPDDEPFFVMHRVYYDQTGGVTNWRALPVPIEGGSPGELVWVLRKMENAVHMPVLDYATGKPIEAAA